MLMHKIYITLVYGFQTIGMVFYRTGPGPRIGTEGIWTSGNVETISQQLNQPASSYNVSSYKTPTTSTGGSTTSTSTSETSTTIGGGTTSTTSERSIYTTPVTPPTSKPAPSYSASRTTTAPTSMAPPQTVASQPSMTEPQVTETTTITPTGVAHLWIGWKIEPWEEDFVKKFVEAFEHGKHVHRPIELPPMGGVLAPIPGAPTAPAPGVPVVILLPPQGAGNQQQQQLTA